MSVFVGRLPPHDFYEEDLEDIFYKYGRIISCQVKKGARYAFGFVEFDDPEDAYYAIKETDGLDIDGVPIVVEKTKGPPRSRYDTRCFNCGEEGHFARDCRSRYRSRDRYSSRSRYRSYSRSRSPYYERHRRSYSRSPRSYSRSPYSRSPSPRHAYNQSPSHTRNNSRSRSPRTHVSRSNSPPREVSVSVSQSNLSPTHAAFLDNQKLETETQTTEQQELVTQNPEQEQADRPQVQHAVSVQKVQSADEQVGQGDQTEGSAEESAKQTFD
ncbi:hypothetical protein BDF20DRAFT_915630 [Mycotypha africana]|uniref:uncharacterized protein n=1 Tax=Mycotypha africana TaxID=64632 RepID=UPI0023013294|nr:uncharacterized protein BDF20DRAFT_915630 [Mycotypha africana]KAI8971878.1 hypothetical protein BDF20DRAFT_915630 [Mycotypha africana]